MKKTVLIILVVFFTIQLIRPTKNLSGNEENSIKKVVEISSEVEQVLKTSCFDCHSNTTVYPWYSNIAPVSWYLTSHVNEGKEHLNFSEWSSYNTDQKNHIISDLEEVLKENEMPLKSYTLIHKNAVLSKKQTTMLLNWVQTIPVN